MNKFLPTSIFLAAATLCAQPPPNFSGAWKLNLAESDYSRPGANKPDGITITIQQ